ncbi:uncharacterized protein LOC135137743 [Zophobas morio]|uniref:uncharacterized protein LOC135137743 n=1 Tax=Zophobas morio TaxID=2755281 RepID=UPI003082B7D1
MVQARNRVSFPKFMVFTATHGAQEGLEDMRGLPCYQRENLPRQVAGVPKTAITTPFGLFEFQFMTFGLRNAVQTSQRFMDEVLQGLDFCYAYIDASPDEHLQHLETVFQRLRQYGAVIDPMKCQPDVKFLGYLVSGASTRPLPEKVEAIRSFPQPNTVKKLRRLNFFRKFLPKAAETQAPLNDLLQGNVKGRALGNWTLATVAAFEACKESLAGATLLSHPEPTIFSDASDLAIGEVVHRRTMVTGNRAHGGGTVFHLYRPQADHVRLSDPRHLDFISQFTTDIRHIAGTADTLSRIEALETSIDFQALAAAQQQDDELERFRTRNTGLQLKLVRIPGCDVSVLCDVSTRTARPFVTKSFRRVAFESIHRLSHPGVEGTVKLVTQYYVWPSVKADRREWARNCVECQRLKVSGHVSSSVGTFSPPSARFEHLHLDIVIVPRSEQSGSNNRDTSLLRSMDRTIRHPAMRTTHLRTTAYHPSANGIVERLHRQLKPAIMCHHNKLWTEPYPPSCSAFEQHGKKTSRPVNSHGTRHGTKKTFLFNDLATSEQVFVRHDCPKQPLQQPHNGPYRVVRRLVKTFVVNIKGRDDTVSIDRLKRAYVLNDDTPTSWFGRDTTRTTPTTDEPAPFADQSRDDDEVPDSTTTRTTRSERRVRFLERLQSGFSRKTLAGGTFKHPSFFFLEF